MSDLLPSAAFREALAHFASGVTVVAARGPAGPAGFTATGFTSVSLSPPLILVCVAKTASAYDGVVGAELLRRQRPPRGPAVDRRAVRHVGDRPLRGRPASASGASSAVPLIEGALAHLECRPHARHDAGDHTLLVGEVLSAVTVTGRPLVHFARNFGAFAPELMPARNPPAA